MGQGIAKIKIPGCWGTRVSAVGGVSMYIEKMIQVARVQECPGGRITSKPRQAGRLWHNKKYIFFSFANVAIQVRDGPVVMVAHYCSWYKLFAGILAGLVVPIPLLDGLVVMIVRIVLVLNTRSH